MGLCSSGCKKHKGVKIHGFPGDPEECERWIKALPNKLPLDKKLHNVGICVRHWPVDHPAYRVKGKDGPVNPPSVFNDVPNSFKPQTLMANPRRLEKWGIDYESLSPHLLTKHENEREIYGPSNVITNWASLIDHVKTLPFHLREKE